jgi:hypothetical protein
MRQQADGNNEGDMSVRLMLDDFGKEALDAQVRDGGSRDAVVRTAARYYLADRDSSRVAWRAPHFACRDHRRRADTQVEVDASTLKALEEEARRQDTIAERLAAHAVLYFLADLETGRANASGTPAPPNEPDPCHSVHATLEAPLSSQALPGETPERTPRREP